MSLRHLSFFMLSGLICAYSLSAKKEQARSPRILSAKTVYVDDQIGSDGISKVALAELKKWGKFQIVLDRKHADLIFILSADPYNGGRIILSGGQTGSIDSSGHIEEDTIPQYGPQSRDRYAYLTVIDATNGDNLWNEERLWGGLLTGFNSVGKRLIKDLERQTKR